MAIPSVPEKFLLLAKVHLTVWWSLWLSYFLKGAPCLYRSILSTNISRHLPKVVPLGGEGTSNPLEGFSANDG